MLTTGIEECVKKVKGYHRDAAEQALLHLHPKREKAAFLLQTTGRPTFESTLCIKNATLYFD